MKNFGPVSCGFLSLLGKFKMPELGFLDQQKMPSWRKLTFFLLNTKYELCLLQSRKSQFESFLGNRTNYMWSDFTKIHSSYGSIFLEKEECNVKKDNFNFVWKNCWVRFGVNFSDLQHGLHFFNGSVYSTYVSWFRAHF